MTSLADSFADPSLPVELHPNDMLREFTMAVFEANILSPDREFDAILEERKIDDEHVGLVLTSDIRVVLFSDLSQEHLDRMIRVVTERRVINAVDIKEMLEDMKKSPKAFSEGSL